MGSQWHRIPGGDISDDRQAVVEKRHDANRTPYWSLGIEPSNDRPTRQFIRFYDQTGLADAKDAYRPGRAPLVPADAHQIRAERTIAITTNDTQAQVLRRLFHVDEATSEASTQLWLVQPDPWGSGDGVDGLVIRAASKQAAAAMAADYHEPGRGVWLAKPLTPEGDAEILFGAERSCWELD